MTDYRPAVAAETDRLLATVRGLPPGSLGAPSLCAGWTRGHVLSHLARNADALDNLVTWATTGVPTPMYASAQARDADIDAGAFRTLSEQLGDLERTAERLASSAATLRPEHDEVPVEARDGSRIRASSIPFMRLREVVIHHVDLDAGFRFADAPDDLVGKLLDNAVRRLAAHPEAPGLRLRTDDGQTHVVGDGATEVTGSRAALLGWLARGLTDGVTADRLPALPFGG